MGTHEKRFLWNPLVDISVDFVKRIGVMTFRIHQTLIPDIMGLDAAASYLTGSADCQ